VEQIKDNEKGIFVIFTAILLIMLMYILGLAVDSGILELNDLRVQRAADAGAVVGGDKIGNLPKEEVESLALYVAQDNMDINNLFYNSNNIAEYIKTNLVSNTLYVDTKAATETFFIGKAVQGNPYWDVVGSAAAQKSPVALTLLLDISSSMEKPAFWNYDSEQPYGKTRLEVLQDITRAVVDNFDEDMGVFTIVEIHSNSNHITYPITEPFDAGKAHRKIDAFNPRGLSNFHHGLIQANKELKIWEQSRGRRDEDFRKVIVLISDGAPNNNKGKSNRYPNGCPSSNGEDNLVWPILEADQSRENGTTLFSIGIGQDDPVGRYRDAFQTLPTHEGNQNDDNSPGVPGAYYMKDITLRRLVNDPAGRNDPPFPENCIPNYEEISNKPQGKHIEINDPYYNIDSIMEQITKKTQLRLIK